jgi:5-methylcytosine-specific restriction endonuclease McrA
MFEGKKPLWRQFEDASPQEREGMVEWYEWWESPDGQDSAKRFFGKDVRIYGFSGIDFHDAFIRLKSVKWKKVIRHTNIWINLRKSFNYSEEWAHFRMQWLQTHPACVRCGRTDVVLQVHHAGQNSLDSSVMEEGFLEGLKHPERFETLCVECHYQEHKPLILNESVLRGKTEAILAQKLQKNEKEVKEKERKLLISLVNPCVDWTKEHGLKKVTETDIDAFLLERGIDHLPRTKRRSLQKLINLYKIWIKEHGLNKVTEADVNAFLLESDIDLSPHTKKGSQKGSLQALVNPCVNWTKEHGLKKVTETDVDAFLLESDIDLSPRTERRSLQALVNDILKSK